MKFSGHLLPSIKAAACQGYISLFHYTRWELLPWKPTYKPKGIPTLCNWSLQYSSRAGWITLTVNTKPDFYRVLITWHEEKEWYCVRLFPCADTICADYFRGNMQEKRAASNRIWVWLCEVNCIPAKPWNWFMSTRGWVLLVLTSIPGDQITSWQEPYMCFKWPLVFPILPSCSICK